jgi:glycosyltransferase involved in cell wall biosynthesis
VAVSPLVKEEFEAMTKTPVELVTNGFDPEDFVPAEAAGVKAKPGAGGAFELVHTGLFAVDGNPERLWRVLREKCLEDREFARRMRITLAGKTDREVAAAIADAGLGENLRDLGYQSHTEVVKLQKEAAVLLLPLRKEPEYRATLPGKLFEYLGARRPILGIGQTDGAMARVLAETASGRTFEWTDDKGIRQYIDSCWESFKAGKLEVPPRDISRFSRPATARQMAQIFDSLI